MSALRKLQEYPDMPPPQLRPRPGTRPRRRTNSDAPRQRRSRRAEPLRKEREPLHRKSEPVQRPNKRTKQERQPKPKKQEKRKLAKQHVEYVHYETKRNRIPLRILFTVFLIFAGGVGTASSFAMLQSTRQEIDRTRAAILLQQDDNTALRSTIVRHFSREEIEYIARERLDMIPREMAPIVFINVPRQSYVMQSIATGQEEPGMWESAWQHIRNWLGV